MEKKLLLANNILKQAELTGIIENLRSKLDSSEHEERDTVDEWKAELEKMSDELSGLELTEIKICAELNKSLQNIGLKMNAPQFAPSTNDLFSRPEDNITSDYKFEHPNSHDNHLHPQLLSGVAHRPISQHFIKSIPKPDRFQKGQNFSRFVRRFVQYITLSKMEGENLDLLFLSFIDHDETFEKLSRVELSELEKSDIKSLVERFEKEIYPNIASQTLKSELQNLCQKSDESAEEFAFRISEIADKAYDNLAIRNESALSAFIRGVRESAIKAKILDAEVNQFNEAIKIATKWEKINAVISPNIEENFALYRIQEPQPDRTYNPGYTNNRGYRHNNRGNYLQNPRQESQNFNRSTYRQGQNSPAPQFNRQIICFACRLPGHRRVECPNVRSNASRPIVCFACNLPGHRRDQCPTTRFNSDRSRDQNFNNYRQNRNNRPFHLNYQQVGNQT